MQYRYYMCFTTIIVCVFRSSVTYIENNKTRELTKLHVGKKAIDVRWVFKLKVNLEGKLVKNNKRSVGKGFLQTQEIFMMKFSHH